MEKAYNLKLMREMDPEEAYELYWDEVIDDTHDFICLEPDCYAQVTLSSANKARYLLKQVPHFRCFGEHKENCPADLKKAGITEQDDGKPGRRNKYSDPDKDILELDRPKTNTLTTTTGPVSNEAHNRIKRKAQENAVNHGKRSSTYVTLSPLVSKFSNHLKDGTLSIHKIVNQGKELTYNTVFVPFEAHTPVVTSKFYRAYYGHAKIFKVPSRPDDFRIVFDTVVTCNGKTYKPNAYISKKIIDQSYKKNKWLTDLNDLCTRKDEIVVFIYGKISFVNSADGKNEYMNLEICRAKLDLIDIRHPDILIKDALE